MQRWSVGSSAVGLLRTSRGRSMVKWRLQCGAKSSSVEAMSLLSWTVEAQAQLETAAHLAKLLDSPAQPDDVRMVGGANPCAGTLELKHLGEWRLMYGFDVTLKDAAPICEHLECGSAVSAEGSTSFRLGWKIRPDCVHSRSALRECATSGYYEPILNLTCSDSVRLLNGSSLCSGRLEVKSNQSWSSVCEADFDQQDAEVVCRELGCGPPSVLQGALYGEVEAPVWSKEFQCGGHESALLDCRSSGSARNSCSPGKAVGLTCSEPVRLVGGANRCGGLMELKHLGEWRPMEHFHWTLKDAAVVCEHLDCGSAVSVKVERKRSSRPSWRIRRDCVPSTSGLRECATPSSTTFILKLTCSDSVRLLNGSSLCSGRLEVKSNQSWSSVCEADFDQQDAEVVCRELGCGPPSVLQGALYGDVEAPVWSKEFQCGGHESALLDCRSSGSARNSCSPGKAVGLTCSEPDEVRMVGGANLCEGTVELRHLGKWRPMEHFHWTLKDAAVVCKHLECGSAVSIGVRSELLGRPSWWIRHDCVTSLSGLRECATPSYISLILKLTCSGPVRLVGGASRCEGTVELKHWGEWRPAIDYDLRKAAVVCEYLDCGSAVSAIIRPKSSPADVLEISSDCFQSVSTRRACVAPNDSNYILDLICLDLLVQPIISVSFMNGVFEAQQQELQVSRGSSFTIRCSIQPQYPGGSFQLIFTSSNTTYSYTQPAVNHSAHFLFPAAESTHQGDYSCVYHIYVFSHNFSSESRQLSVTVSGLQEAEAEHT
uniref:Scavenger receptor cysteine-rich type 1 protein M130-like n=1 Tax=Oreochromis aureus TaxID=47969 RepID=A0A668U0G5_OREAU